MPSYRRLPRYRYPAIREDISAALLKVVELMEQRNLPDQRIILGGMSAGANLVALLLYDRVSLAKVGLQADLFSGILLCGGPLDLSKMWDSPLLRAYASKKGSAVFRQANPVDHLSGNESTPVLCIHGEKDGLVAFGAARSFIDQLQQHEAAALETILLPEGTHLDAGSWNFHDNHIRQQLLSWLKKLEELPS